MLDEKPGIFRTWGEFLNFCFWGAVFVGAVAVVIVMVRDLVRG